MGIRITPELTEKDFKEPVSFEPVAPGNYTLEVKGTPTLRLGKSGAHYLNVQLAHTGEYANKGSVWTNVMIEGAAKFQLGTFLSALGIREAVTITSDSDLSDDVKEVPATLSINGDAISVDGRTVRAKIGIEEYNGKTKNVVDTFFAA